MSIQITWELILNILHIVVLISVIVTAAKKTGKSGNLFAPFFIFGMMALVLEDVYWIAYDFIRPEGRMPFAGNEIACSAFLLLIGAAMETRIDKNLKRKLSELVIATVFIAVNAALWIIWSGEWFQDIIFAIPYIYYLYVLIRGLRSSKAVSRTETYVFLFISIYVFGTYFAALALPEGMQNLLYYINYAVINGTSILLFAKIIRRRNRNDAKEKAFFISFALLLWTMLVVYMSEGVYYCIALFINILAFPVVLDAVIRAAGENHNAQTTDQDPGKSGGAV